MGEAPSGRVAVEIKGLVLDPSSNLPIVVLRDPEGDRFLPIWIGVFEAQAIALRLEEVNAPRPLTHDLLQNLIRDLGASVARVVVTDLRDNTFFAEIHLQGNAGDQVIDSRPSDAIALALRAEAPLFVNELVFEKARADGLHEKIGDDERLKKWLEDAEPEDFGKYKM